MTEQEEKELELFKKWVNSDEGVQYTYEQSIAEQAWFARSKLDKERNEKENL